MTVSRLMSGRQQEMGEYRRRKAVWKDPNGWFDQRGVPDWAHVYDAPYPRVPNPPPTPPDWIIEERILFLLEWYHQLQGRNLRENTVHDMLYTLSTVLYWNKRLKMRENIEEKDHPSKKCSTLSMERLVRAGIIQNHSLPIVINPDLLERILQLMEWEFMHTMRELSTSNDCIYVYQGKPYSND